MAEWGEPGYLNEHNARAARARSFTEPKVTITERHRTGVDHVDELLGGHVGHEARNVGRCVWCETCGTRLFQGHIKAATDG